MNELTLLLLSLFPAATDGVEVLEFTSTRCPACVQMDPIVDRLKRGGFPVVKVDPAQRPDLTQRYGVTAMPTFIVLVNGKPFDRHTGVMSESRLRNMILAGKRSLPKPTTVRPSPAVSRGGVAKKPKIELLDFTADYCQSCVSMEPILTGLKRAGFPVRKVNVSEDWAVTRRHKVRVLPTFVVTVDGKELRRHDGVATESQLRTLVTDARRIAGVDSRPAAGPRRSTNPLALLGLDGKADDAQPRRSREPVVRAKLDQRDKSGAVIQRSGPMAASVRLRIRVASGKQVNLGSGTVIESQPGRSLVLTCAHLIDKAGKNADIDVHVFTGDDPHPKSWKGEVIFHDIKSDVGLIAVRCPGPLPVAPIAAASVRPQIGTAVYSVGCGRGSFPTREDMKIVEINRYNGAANIECSTTPEGGRSGGGLFNKRGEIIGVCSAADKDLNEGIYAGPPAIFAMLDRQELTYLYDDDDSQRVATRSDDESTEIASIDHLPVKVRELMSEIGDAEVTCVINPLSGADSRVVIIHKASPQFVDWLEGELDSQPQPAMHTVKSATKVQSEAAVEKRMLTRPVLSSDASHSRTWPYTVRRPVR